MYACLYACVCVFACVCVCVCVCARARVRTTFVPPCVPPSSPPSIISPATIILSFSFSRLRSPPLCVTLPVGECMLPFLLAKLHDISPFRRLAPAPLALRVQRNGLPDGPVDAFGIVFPVVHDPPKLLLSQLRHVPRSDVCSNPHDGVIHHRVLWLAFRGDGSALPVIFDHVQGGGEQSISGPARKNWKMRVESAGNTSPVCTHHSSCTDVDGSAREDRN